MSNRFHSKFHRSNHHTNVSGTNADAGHDPIASKDSPFQGDFYLNGGLNITGDTLINGNTLITGNLSALGNWTELDTYVNVTSAMSITNTGTGPALYVKQTGDQAIAAFYDDSNTALYVDGHATRAGNVGINTSIPNEKLTIVGNLSTQGHATILSNDSSTALEITQQGLGDSFKVSDQVNDNTTFVIDNAGHVGIGLAKADTSTLLTLSAIGNDNGVKITTPGGTATYALLVEDETNDQNPFIVTSTGDVGIGTATPTTKLDVYNGSIRVGSPNSSSTRLQGTHVEWNRVVGGGATWILNQKGTGDGGFNFGEVSTSNDYKPTLYFNTNVLAFTGNRMNLGKDGDGMFWFKVGDQNNEGINNGVAARFNGVAYGIQSNGSWPTTHTWVTSGVERMRITESGNIGVGTSTPGEKLTLVGNISAVGHTNFIANDTYTAVNIIQNGNGNAFRVSDQLSDNSVFVIDNSGHVGIGRQTTYNNIMMSISAQGNDNGVKITTPGGTATYALLVEDETNDQNPFVINAVGNVGIGTATPAEKLEVNGGAIRITKTSWPSLALNSTAVGSWKSSVSFLSGGTGKWEIGTDITANGNNNFYFYDGVAGLERMRIDPNGYLLIGTSTTSGTSKLQINGTARVSDLAGTGNRTVYSDASGNLTNTASDSTLKTNISALNYSIEDIEALNPVSYNWINTEKYGEQREIGLIAQEVKDVIPEVVGINFDNTYSLDYSKLTSLLIKGIKDLKSIIDSQATAISDLQSQINTLKGVN